MKFKIDENIPLEISKLLSESGYNCENVYNENLNGKTDIDVIKKCLDENRILITCDMDFSDIRTYPPDNISGIIILRPDRQSKNNIIDLVKKIIPIFAIEKLYNHLWIVSNDKIRIKGKD